MANGKDLHENVCKERVYASLYHKHSQNLKAFLYSKFGTQISPMDFMQEAFLIMWKKCADIPPSKAKSFLYTTANNLLLNAYRHEKYVLDYQQNTSQKINREDGSFKMQEKEYLERFKKALTTLTQKERTAFILNRVEGKSIREITEILDIGKKAVDNRIYRALEKMRKKIKEIP